MKYHKIPTVFRRDPNNKYKTLLIGKYATPELEYLKDNIWILTEKVDGINTRVMWDGERVTFGGRTDNAQIPAFLFTKLQELFPANRLAEVFDFGGVTLFGEGYGNRIYGNRIQKAGKGFIPDGVDFILFDVNIGGLWLERHNVEDIAAKLSLRVVPILAEGPLDVAVNIAAEGFASRVAFTDIEAEGLVMRPKVEMLDRRGHRIIAKIKHRDFSK